MDTVNLINASFFAGAAFSIGFGAIGAAVGEGYAAGMANEALSLRPEKSGDIIKNMLVGQAIAETAAIFALVIAVLLLFTRPDSTSILNAWAGIGAALAIGLSAVGSGVGSGLPAARACEGIMRQPANSGKIIRTMLIGAAVCQSPAVFGMGNAGDDEAIARQVALVGAGPSEVIVILGCTQLEPGDGVGDLQTVELFSGETIGQWPGERGCLGQEWSRQDPRKEEENEHESSIAQDTTSQSVAAPTLSPRWAGLGFEW